MLAHTFIHLPGVGAASERRLWSAGAHSWDRFLALQQDRTLRGRRTERLAPLIEESQAALRRSATDFFAARLPIGERWRMLSSFADRSAFFDIETTGLDPEYDRITVVGLYDGERFRAFVRGRDLEDFPRVASRYPLLVSYNGEGFDLRFLRVAFPRFRPQAHVDLRVPLKRMGFSGGLKGAERSVGIERPREVQDMDGLDAIYLWNEYKRGRSRALERLIAYTRQDVVNLVPLAEHVAREMPDRAGFPGIEE